MNPKVDFYFTKENWQQEIALLRSIILATELTEELKWGVPCYVLGKSNVVLIHVFKEYCAMLFFKGALMKDTGGLLVQQTENVQAARQLRFTSLAEVKKLKTLIRAYLLEAIALEKTGEKVEYKKTTEYLVPAEFQHKLDRVTGLKSAFDALTPGRQRGYLLHFSSAKQASTREARVDKYLQQILEGKGLDD